MKFKINEIEYGIYELDSLDTRLIVNGSDCAGACAFNKKEIYLLKDCNIDFKRKTLIHEITHSYLNECLLLRKDKYTEEEICEFVAIYASQILRIVDKYFKDK